MDQSNQIILGKFGSPYGIKGWLKVISYTDPIENLLSYLPWTVIKAGEHLVIEKVKGKVHGKNLIVQFDSCLDRDIAQTYTNLEIYVKREQLPATSEDEYYWVDLIGLTVVNIAQENLGKITGLFSTGANDVIVANDDKAERYIPYIKDVIQEVDLKNKRIIVDWDPSF